MLSRQRVYLTWIKGGNETNMSALWVIRRSFTATLRFTLLSAMSAERRSFCPPGRSFCSLLDVRRRVFV